MIDILAHHRNGHFESRVGHAVNDFAPFRQIGWFGLNAEAFQDDIVKRVLIDLQVKLTHGETARLMSQGTDNLDAWLANVRGVAEGFKWTRENNYKARGLFEQASRADPDWAVPISLIAWTHREALRRGWSNNAESDRKKWLEHALNCKEMAPEFFGCYIQLGNYFIENGQVEEGISLREIALELAPSDLYVLSGLAWQLILTGEVREDSKG